MFKVTLYRIFLQFYVLYSLNPDNKYKHKKYWHTWLNEQDFRFY